MSSTPPPAPPSRGVKIFVNYRRDDAGGYAGRLYEWLSERFGRERVFRDINAIEPGADFVAAIEAGIAACEVVLVIIGRQWLRCDAEGRRRLDDANDFVRLEIVSALALNAHVIPVLVGGASMPREDELPDDLKPLARRQALELSESRWEFDAGRLIDTVEERLEKRAGGAGGRAARGPSKLGRYRPLFPARRLCGLLVLTGALVAQSYSLFRPRVENVGALFPATSKLGSHELTIKEPLTNSEEGRLLYHGGRPEEIVDVEIAEGVLDGETLMQFGEHNPPTAPARVAYETTKQAERPAAEPCRTFVEVRLADRREPPAALRFYQLDSPGGDDYRHLTMKAEGGRLLLNVITDSPDDDERGAGCRKLLKVSPDFERPTAGTYGVRMVAERGAAVHFRFNPTGARNQLWDGPGGLFRPFDLGAEKQAPSDPPPLRARAVEITPLGRQPAASEPLLSVQSPEGGELLSVESLLVGSDGVQINVSGRGLVKVDGRDRVDLLERVKTNPLRWTLLALCDAVLLAWLVRPLFSRERSALR